MHACCMAYWHLHQNTIHLMESREFGMQKNTKGTEEKLENKFKQHSEFCVALVGLFCWLVLSQKHCRVLHTLFSMQHRIHCMFWTLSHFSSLSFLQVVWASSLCHYIPAFSSPFLSFSKYPIPYKQDYIKISTDMKLSVWTFLDVAQLNSKTNRCYV